jgi:hypothetical protein
MTPGEVLAARVTTGAPDWQLSLLDVDDDEWPRRAPSLIDGGLPWTELADHGPEADIETIPAIPPAPIDSLVATEPEPVVPTPSPLAVEDSTRVNDLRDQLRGGEVELARLRSDLSAVRQEHHLLKSQFGQAQRNVEGVRRQLEQARSRLRTAGRRQVVRDLPEFADPEQRFRIEVTLAWASRTPLDEQRTRPLPQYSIGPAFLSSVGSIEGISRDKISGVVFEVLIGRAQQMPSRELHQLRENETGNAPVVRRPDGAVCWPSRCSPTLRRRAGCTTGRSRGAGSSCRGSCCMTTSDRDGTRRQAEGDEGHVGPRIRARSSLVLGEGDVEVACHQIVQLLLGRGLEHDELAGDRVLDLVDVGGLIAHHGAPLVLDGQPAPGQGPSMIWLNALVALSMAAPMTRMSPRDQPAM